MAEVGPLPNQQPADSYEDWLNRTVDNMPPLTEQQQQELRQLLRWWCVTQSVNCMFGIMCR